jgi:hypothetical protein
VEFTKEYFRVMLFYYILLKSWIVKLDPETVFFLNSQLENRQRPRDVSDRHATRAPAIFFDYIYLKLKVSVHNFDIFDNSQRFASLVK